ncbi:hypothetical protein K493DRAFT_371590, partial [Basidiobolus meristosporus CBS 931.73]
SETTVEPISYPTIDSTPRHDHEILNFHRRSRVGQFGDRAGALRERLPGQLGPRADRRRGGRAGVHPRYHLSAKPLRKLGSHPGFLLRRRLLPQLQLQPHQLVIGASARVLIRSKLRLHQRAGRSLRGLQRGQAVGKFGLREAIGELGVPHQTDHHGGRALHQQEYRHRDRTGNPGHGGHGSWRDPGQHV